MNESNGETTTANQGSRRDDTSPRRPARSRNGCMTCRRRKVRCDEQRPRCSHCERLNLECRWWQSPSPFFGTGKKATPGPSLRMGENGTPNGATEPSPDELYRNAGATRLRQQHPEAVDQLFDFASFMWDSGDMLGHISPGPGCGGYGTDVFGAPHTQNSPYHSPSHAASQAMTADVRPWPSGHRDPPGDLIPWNPPVISASATARLQVAEDRHLIEYFAHSVAPPILAEVETQKAWSGLRQMFVSMSNVSTMVRCAILAFSNLLLRRRDAPWMQCGPQHYESAAAQLLVAAGDIATVVSHSQLRENLLVTVFFLSYVDILEDRVESAHLHLQSAFEIFRQGEKSGFRPLEIRVLSWIRLLDARVVSAGGEGLFLSDNCEAILVQPSPVSVPERDNDGSAQDEVRESDIEDVLFQVLYHPGIVFFQKVQSFMGRISNIDRWHRSRGTVEDETEVINIALKILKDLRKLYDNRPTLMDHAVAGHLAAPHVSRELAFSTTRAFRTYLSNYHASKVHLHRVAYRELPLTRETQDALQQIRHLTRLMVAGQPDEDSLPVSQLWPLLMLGSEEKDLAEREWIKTQILRMKKVATNAGITAQLLDEVQARQDSSGERVDIRAVMHDIFDSCFAIM